MKEKKEPKPEGDKKKLDYEREKEFKVLKRRGPRATRKTRV